MKKRLICLFLCLVMLISLVLTSCSKKDEETASKDIITEGSESALTLTMWIVSDEKVSDQAASAVSNAINAITKAKFKTSLVLKYLTTEEYEATLASTITAYEESKKNTTVVETEAVETQTGDVAVTDETVTNEFGQSVIKYPELIANQVDIIYIGGKDGDGEKMYVDFINKGWLAELDTELSSSSKKIKEYVSSTLLSAAKYNGTTYAIPNNRVIGEYTYMLLNKDLMEKYAQDAYAKLDMIDGLYNDYLYSFLNLVHKFESDTVVPLDMNEEFDEQFYLSLLAHYWYIDSADYSLDLDKFSLFGYHYDNIEDLTRGSTILGYNSLFEDEDFVEDYLQFNRFRLDGYFGDATKENKTAAVKFVKGTYADLADYEDDYYSVVVEYPTATSEDIYGNMFGVCKYSRDVARSMEIITYLNTNADFRNLLQYGIEGTHYEVETNENGNFVELRRLNNDYIMPLDATGNMFIAYPDTVNGMSADVWESGKVQNRSSLVDPLLGLDFAEYSATTGATTEAPTIDKDKGYNLSYTTGYSKDVLSQNEILAKWINDCDAAGKGLYVLKTSLTESQNVASNFYIYNNNLAKNASFSVEEVRDITVTTDDNGKETESQTNLDFVLTYTDASGSSKTPGYQLSLMSLYTKKANEYEILGKTNDSNTDVQIKEMSSLLTFDFLNTQQYSIEVFNNLTKTQILKNDTLIDWVENCKSVSTPTSYMRTYENPEVVNGKKEYTYVIYRAGLKYETALDVLPTGKAGELNLAFNFTHDQAYQVDTVEGKYIICYVRVTVDESIVPTYTITSNGKAESVSASNLTTNLPDPDFTICGNLDTELVKYLQNLNDELVAFIETKYNAIKTEYDTALAAVPSNAENAKATKAKLLEKAMSDIEAVVKEIGYLLSTNAKVVPEYSEDTMPLLYESGLLVDANFIADDRTTVDTESVENNALALLHRYVLSAVSKDVIKITTLDENNNVEDAYYGGTSETGEAYVYFTSPYGIYYSWLEKYGFLPATAKK